LNPNRDFKGVWIPKETWLNKELTWMEKIFFVEIDSLDNENGCFASNNYFADFFMVTPQRCSQVINSLIKKKYVKAAYEREGKRVIKRVLNIFDKGIKYSYKGIKYPLEGYKENVKENNTVNNTINNKEDSPSPTNKSLKKKKYVVDDPPDLEEIREYITEMGYPIDAKEFYDKLNAREWTDRNGKKYILWKSVVVTYGQNAKKWEMEKAKTRKAQNKLPKRMEAGEY